MSTVLDWLMHPLPDLVVLLLLVVVYRGGRAWWRARR